MSKRATKYFSKSVADTLSENQKAVIERYDNIAKLRAVMRWRERMVRKNITNVQIADDVGVSHTRISEYINFQRQPREAKFLEIESAIYNREA